MTTPVKHVTGFSATVGRKCKGPGSAIQYFWLSNTAKGPGAREAEAVGANLGYIVRFCLRHQNKTKQNLLAGLPSSCSDVLLERSCGSCLLGQCLFC
jgi:hypothetical protein